MKKRVDKKPWGWEDIYFGFTMAKEIGLLDIGQTVAVKKKAVVAVEALEGTDNLIKRAGGITRGGFTLIKTSKPKQDVRFDVPVVGLDTLNAVINSGGRVLALEEKKVFLADKEEAIKLADEKGVSIVVV